VKGLTHNRIAECKQAGLVLARLSNIVTSYEETSLGGVSKRGMQADRRQKNRNI